MPGRKEGGREEMEEGEEIHLAILLIPLWESHLFSTPLLQYNWSWKGHLRRLLWLQWSIESEGKWRPDNIRPCRQF